MLRVNAGRPVRILLAIDGLGTGGAERQFCLLSRGLKDSVELSVMAFRAGGMVTELESMGINPVIAGKACRTTSFDLRTSLSHISAFRPDIVHSWGWMSSFFWKPPPRWVSQRFMFQDS